MKKLIETDFQARQTAVPAKADVRTIAYRRFPLNLSDEFKATTNNRRGTRRGAYRAKLKQGTLTID